MKWIKVTDEQPSNESTVLACIYARHTNTVFIEMATWYYGAWFKYEGREMDLYDWEVTHWMYLPELPTD